MLGYQLRLWGGDGGQDKGETSHDQLGFEWSSLSWFHKLTLVKINHGFVLCLT